MAASFSALNILKSLDLISCISMLLHRGRSYYLVTKTKIKSKEDKGKNPLFYSPPSRKSQQAQRGVADPFTDTAKSADQTLMLT